MQRGKNALRKLSAQNQLGNNPDLKAVGIYETIWLLYVCLGNQFIVNVYFSFPG